MSRDQKQAYSEEATFYIAQNYEEFTPFNYN
jgi:hypothetical protein